MSQVIVESSTHSRTHTHIHTHISVLVVFCVCVCEEPSICRVMLSAHRITIHDEFVYIHRTYQTHARISLHSDDSVCMCVYLPACLPACLLREMDVTRPSFIEMAVYARVYVCVYSVLCIRDDDDDDDVDNNNDDFDDGTPNLSYM